MMFHLFVIPRTFLCCFSQSLRWSSKHNASWHDRLSLSFSDDSHLINLPFISDVNHFGLLSWLLDHLLNHWYRFWPSKSWFTKSFHIGYGCNHIPDRLVLDLEPIFPLVYQHSWPWSEVEIANILLHVPGNVLLFEQLRCTHNVSI